MPHITRKKFLQTSALLLGSAVIGNSFDLRKRKPLLAFSTLGCPDWSFTKIMEFAALHGYKGIEVRGLQRQIDLTKVDIFSKEKIASTLELMKEKKLEFVNLGSSANLHFAEGAERNKNLDDAKRYIDLAQQINCPFIRVFPNNFPKDQDRNVTIELITKGLLALGEYAKGSNVSVLMETHGELVKTDDLEKIMQGAHHPHTGLVWDIANMWTITKESPATVHKRLKKYIRHTHIKDATLLNGKLQYVLLNKGDVPVSEAIAVLQTEKYKGYYSFEWEKLWHPDIEEPEIALADFPTAIKQHFK